MADIFRSVATTLHLGNVRFDEVDDSNSASGTRVSGVSSSGGSSTSFATACALLGVSSDDLLKGLSTKETTAAGQTTVSQLSAATALLSVEALALELYNRTFGRLVTEINEGIKRTCVEKLGVSPDFGRDPNSLFIGILDIFGFEVFDQSNGFEQLLINYANERLHNLFIKHVFKLEEQKYRDEHIDFSAIRFKDNKIVIDLINKKPLGLFHQISDACMFNKMTDERLLNQMCQKLKRKTDRNGNPTPASCFRNPGFKFRNKFVVVHSANEVMYSVDQFIEKNKDLLPPTVERLLEKKSRNKVSAPRCRIVFSPPPPPFLVPLFPHSADITHTHVHTLPQLVLSLFQPKASPQTTAKAGGRKSGRGGAGGRSTLTGANVMLSLRFDENISKLVQTIEVTALSFVRCVKSNECKKPFFFNADKVYNQLQYLGVLDSIRIRHDGFSYQKRYQEFFEYYVIVVPAGGGNENLKLTQPDGCDYKALSEQLFEVLWSWGGGTLFPAEKRNELVQFGDTKIFMRKQLSQSLEALREVKLRNMDEATVRIQASFRMFRARRIIRSFYGGFLRLQSAWRAIRYRRIWLKRRQATLTIQNQGRAFCAYRKFQRQRKAVRTIQSFVRIIGHKLRWTRLRRGLRTLHSLSRGYIVRQHVLKMLMAIRTLQDFCRAFLKRNKEYWAKVRAALLFQAVWRGFKVRVEREDIVDYLQLRREERSHGRAVRVIQGYWRTTLVRRRFVQICQANRALQVYVRSVQLRGRFLRVCRAARIIQRIARGYIARKRVRDMRTVTMVADELWRLKTVREREALQLKVINDAPDSVNNGRGRRLKVPAFVAPRRGRGSPVKGRAFQFKVVDVDTLVDSSDVYPKGWSAAYGDLDHALRRANQRIEYVAIGASHACALDSTGTLWTWGWGDRGQLGHGNWNNYNYPRKVDGLAYRGDRELRKQGQRHNVTGAFGHDIALRTTVRQISAGTDHCVALSDNGVVWTWGSGSRGQLGHGWGNGAPGSSDTKSDDNSASFNKYSVKSHTPRRVENLKRTVVEVATGAYHTVALVNAGSLYIWGAGSQLGLGVFVGDGDRALPSCIKTLTKFRVRHINAGESFTCATTHSGDLYTWGRGSHGQLGHGDDADRVVPCVVASLRGNTKHARISDVACGAKHTLALAATGRVYAWGWNGHGQLGLGHRDDVSAPTLLNRLRKRTVTQVACGWRASMCMLDQGELFGWGMVGCVVRPQDNKKKRGSLADSAALYRRSNSTAVPSHHDASRDPDADNTQFETSVPLQVPWNPSSGRRPIGVFAASSRTQSIFQVRYRQDAVARRRGGTTSRAGTAGGPLLLDRSQLLREAAHLVEDHSHLEVDALQRNQLKEQVRREELIRLQQALNSGGGNTQAALTLLNADAFGAGRPGQPMPTPHANPFSVTHEDLETMTGKQLRALVIDLQNSSSDRIKMKPASPPRSLEQRRAKGVLKHALRRGRNDVHARLAHTDPEDRAVEYGLTTYGAGDTRGEMLGTYLHRGHSPYATERAREKAWSGTGKRVSPNKTKSRRRVGPFSPASDSAARPVRHDRTTSVEANFRTEMLKFSSGHEEDGAEYLAKALTGGADVLSKKSAANSSKPTARPGFGMASEAKTAAKQLEDERRKQLDLAVTRIAKEGAVEGGSMLEYFTPEQLVATSNDDVQVQDVMRMRLARGAQCTPLRPRRKYIPPELVPYFEAAGISDAYNGEGTSAGQPREPGLASNSPQRSVVGEEDRGLTLRNMITKTLPDPKQRNRKYTVGMGDPAPALNGKMSPSAIAAASSYRERVDVLDSFRERQQLQQTPSYSGNFTTMESDIRKGQWSGRRASRADMIRQQISSEILAGEPTMQQNASATPGASAAVAGMSPDAQQRAADRAEIERLRAQLNAIKSQNDAVELQQAAQQRAAEQQQATQEQHNRLLAQRQAQREAAAKASNIKRRASFKASAAVTAAHPQHPRMHHHGDPPASSAPASAPSSEITSMIDAIKAKADREVNGLLEKHQHRNSPSAANSRPRVASRQKGPPTPQAPTQAAPQADARARTGSVNDMFNYVKKVSAVVL